MAHLDRAGTALPQPSPSSCSSGSLGCPSHLSPAGTRWPLLAAGAGVSQGRCEERGLPWQEQQLLSVPSSCWVISALALRAGRERQTCSSGSTLRAGGHLGIPKGIYQHSP